MRDTLVILVVGLAPHLLGPHTPQLNKLVARGGLRHLNTVTPAVTCTVQATLATGLMPSEHGIVGNGWYFDDLKEILLWRQPNSLVHGEKIWDAGKKVDPGFTCAKMFWWYNMYATADWSATPRPMYPADGRKIPDHYAYPADLHDELDAKLGKFPLFKFWGPLTDRSSSDWIAQATIHVMQSRGPTLALTYLPHLDYNLQRLGPDLNHPTLQQDLREIDEICGDLIKVADAQDRRIVVVSEYGITETTDAIHINRALRKAGLIAVRPEENGREVLDAGASAVFAMADHQIAHIYINDSSKRDEARKIIASLDGVENIWEGDDLAANGLDHPRSGDMIAVSEADRWFSYYYWLDEAKSPDFARTVDIHRKPGYDPVELFMDPDIKYPKLAAGLKLAKRKLGFRQLMDVISQSETQLVKGSHGRITDDPDFGPLVISSEAGLLPDDHVNAVDFKALVLDHVFKSTS